MSDIPNALGKYTAVKDWAQYPRLYSLFEDSEAGNPANYFSAVSQLEMIDPTVAVQYYSQLETALATLNEKAWNQFRSKALPYISVVDERRDYQQLFNVFNEVKGYLYLLSQGYGDIEFIEENNKRRSPDLIAYNQDDVILLEVKTINSSDNHLKRMKDILARKVTVAREVSHGLSASLKNKITETIYDNSEQLLSYKLDNKSISQKIFYICIHLDEGFLAGDNDENAVHEFCQSLSSENLEIISDIIII